MRGGLRRARLGCTCCTASPRSRTLFRTIDYAALPARSLCRVVSHHQLIAIHLRSTHPILRDCDKVITASPCPPMKVHPSHDRRLCRPRARLAGAQCRHLRRCFVWALTKDRQQTAQDPLPALGGRSGPVSAVSQEGNQLRLRRAVTDSQTIREERRGSEGTLRQRRAGLVRPVDLFIIIIIVFVRLAAVYRQRGLARPAPARQLVWRQALRSLARQASDTDKHAERRPPSRRFLGTFGQVQRRVRVCP